MGLQFSDNYQCNAPKNIDNKSGVFESGAWRAYTSIAEAQIKVPFGARSIGLTQLILLDGVATEYWYRNGIEDFNLIVKTSGGPTITAGTGLRLDSSVMKLGLDLTSGEGAMTEPTILILASDDNLDSTSLIFNKTATAAAAQISVNRNGASANINFNSNPLSVTSIGIQDDIRLKGATYLADYSAQGKLDDRWIPDWGAVKSSIPTMEQTRVKSSLLTDGFSITNGVSNGITRILTQVTGPTASASHVILGATNADQISIQVNNSDRSVGLFMRGGGAARPSIDFNNSGLNFKYNSASTPINTIFPDGRMSGTDAINNNEFVTLSQINTNTNFIKNQTGQQASSNFNISGTGVMTKLGIGATPAIGVNFSNNVDLTGSNTTYGELLQSTIKSDVTVAAYGHQVVLSTEAASFTLPTITHYSASGATKGAGSTINTQIGFAVQAPMTTGTNNYGFYGGLDAATGRWNLYMVGTAQNYIRGSVGVGVIIPTEKLDVNGNGKFAGTVDSAIPPTIGSHLTNKTYVDSLTASGTYTPVATPIGNVTSLTIQQANYTRVGNQVTVYGSFTSYNASAGGQTFEITLPIASNMTVVSDLNGHGSARISGDDNISILIEGNSTTDRAILSIIGGTTATGNGKFSFMYTVK